MTRPTDSQGVAGPDDGDPAAAKRRLREQALKRRDAMAGAQRLAAGEALRARLVALPVVASATTILCFASFRSEIDTAPLIGWCLEHGVAVALPRIIGPRHMEAFAVTDPEADLTPGRYDIPEPREGLALVDPAAIDVVIVPGSAFDREGGRMGYGGGFYDAFLRRLRPDAWRIGIGFEAQLVERVPREAHDLCVDLLVTEERVLETACRPAAGAV
jgi:5-formyltetrahydrofolate cyclo-ligase